MCPLITLSWMGAIRRRTRRTAQHEMARRGFTRVWGKTSYCPFSKCLIFTGMSKVLSLFSASWGLVLSSCKQPLIALDVRLYVMWTRGCFHIGLPSIQVVTLMRNHLWAANHLLNPPKALWPTETNPTLKIVLMQCDSSETSRDIFFVCFFSTTNGSVWGLPRVKLQTIEPNFYCADVWGLAHYKEACPSLGYIIRFEFHLRAKNWSVNATVVHFL